MNLVFVCTGNICRSPMAEGMFKKLLEEKGTDPKDPNSVPQVDPKPVKPDQKQDPEISQNKVVNNVVNNSYKKPISNAPKTGDFGNGTGYTGLAALAAGLMLLLGIKKKRKEEDGEE